MPKLTVSPTSDLRLGGIVTFDAEWPKGTKNPTVTLAAFQDGELVWGDTDSPTADYKLGGYSSEWVKNGGGAHVVAHLIDLWFQHGRQQIVILAVCEFDATG